MSFILGVSNFLLILFIFPWFTTCASHARPYEVFNEEKHYRPSNVRSPYLSFPATTNNRNVFNVKQYGAISDGKTDNSLAFLRAWHDACRWNGESTILIPLGLYVVDSVEFVGPCKGSIVFFLEGVLNPPSNLGSSEHWINFRYVNELTVSGGGTIDAQGYRVWGLPSGSSARNVASMTLGFVNDARIQGIRSYNSRNAHFTLFACQNVNITQVRIAAPGDSPNTDGIKIGSSANIQISQTTIGTGDDCVAIITGSRNIDISEVACGPGHGVSIGSLGMYRAGIRDIVTGISVRNCSFTGTTNGVRIKTWASPEVGLASNFTYQNIRMTDVENPIIIDQEYCPFPPCNKVPSHIQIEDITYDNIWGTSSTKVAVGFKCSKTFPCRGIVVKDINLIYNGVGGPTTSSCYNAIGKSYGLARPASCL